MHTVGPSFSSLSLFGGTPQKRLAFLLVYLQNQGSLGIVGESPRCREIPGSINRLIHPHFPFGRKKRRMLEKIGWNQPLGQSTKKSP